MLYHSVAGRLDDGRDITTQRRKEKDVYKAGAHRNINNNDNTTNNNDNNDNDET